MALGCSDLRQSRHCGRASVAWHGRGRGDALVIPVDEGTLIPVPVYLDDGSTRPYPDIMRSDRQEWSASQMARTMAP